MYKTFSGSPDILVGFPDKKTSFVCNFFYRCFVLVNLAKKVIVLVSGLKKQSTSIAMKVKVQISDSKVLHI